MLNAFVLGGVTVQFNTRPAREGTATAQELLQVEGYDSDGGPYVYDKSTLQRLPHTVVFPRLTDALRAELEAFASDTVRGSFVPFTWYNHAGTPRTVTLSGPIAFTRLGYDRHRAEITLVEYLSWSPAAPPASFAAARAAMAGIGPVWILKLTINGTAYHLSDSALTLTGWGGQTVTTLPLIAAWGQVREEVTGDLNEIRIAEFSCDCLIDPAASPNLEDLVTTYPVEESPAELYLWFVGLDPATDPPDMKLRGYVKECGIPDETVVRFTIEDEATRLQAYVGTRIDLTAYPEADPDDVGKVIPIVYGTVEKLPALAVDAGVQTSLPNNINASVTTFALSSLAGLAVNSVIQLDDEDIKITGKSGDTVTTCIRGYSITHGNSRDTTAAIHTKGAVAWEKKTSFAYLAADHALDAMPKVWGRVGQTEVDITAVCTRYLGSPGNEHASYPGKAVVTVPGYITVEQAVDLLVNDGIAINDALAIIKTGSASRSGSITKTGSASKSGSAAKTGTVTSGSHTHSAAVMTVTVPFEDFTPHANDLYPDALLDGNFNTGAVLDNGQAARNIYRRTPYSAGGTPTRLRLHITGGDSSPVNGYATIGNGTVSTAAGGSTKTSSASSWMTFTDWGDLVDFSAAISTSVADARVWEVWIEVEYDPSVSPTTAPVTDGIGVSDTISVADTIAVSDSLTVGDNIDATRSGSITKTGTVTLSGNSVANTLVGDMVMVDCVRTISAPDAVVDNFLQTYCGDTTLQVSGTFPGSYAFNGSITEYRRKIDWLDSFGFQSRSWFRRVCGVSWLIVRPDTLTPIKTIPACRLDDDGRKAYGRAKVSEAQIINKLHLLFDRDWTQPRSDRAYRGVSKGTDSASIAVHGEREQPELFLFDFVTGQAMADSLRAFYLARHATRGWLHTFAVYLDHSELKFGDVVTLGFSGNAVGEIMSAGLSPGSKDAIDTVALTVLVP